MTKSSTKKAIVSLRGVQLRINRALAPRGEMLKISRSKVMRNTNGRFYVVNFKTNTVTGDVDLEALARKLSVLNDWEIVQ